MAAYTTTGTAPYNWSNLSMWQVGGAAATAIPGNGDTVINTKALTVDVNVTIGASNGVYASGSNPAAFQNNAGGTLIIAAGITFTVRGDFNSNTGYNVNVTGITMQAGSTFQFDSSTTSPTTTAYRYQNISGNNANGHSLKCNGTQASPCYVISNSGGANGRGSNGGSTTGQGSLTATWTYFQRLGSSTLSCWDCAANSNTNMSLTNCTFDTCGMLHGYFPSSGQTNQFTNVVFKNSLGTSNTDNVTYCTYNNVVFDAPSPVGNAIFTGTSFTNCYLVSLVGSGNYKWNGANYCFMKHGGVDLVGCGDIINCLLFCDRSLSNPHAYNNATTFGHSWTGNIYEYTNSDDQGDSMKYTGTSGTTAMTHYSNYNIILPNPAGSDSMDALTMAGSYGSGGYAQLVYEHNVFMMGGCPATFSENATIPTGTISSFRHNIAWDTVARNGILCCVTALTSNTDNTVDIAAPGNIQRNGVWKNVPVYTPGNPTWLVNQGNGYYGSWSVTPGATDLNCNPLFVDTTRNTATFDTVYMGNVAGSTWASHASTDTFTVGQIVSHTDSNYYNGAVINFRCISAHTKSTSGSEPGNGTVWTNAWRTYWEFASCNTIRNNLAGGASGLVPTFSDSTLGLTNVSIVSILINWIKRGFCSQNTSFRGAAIDGSDIGAMPVLGANQAHSMMGCG